MRVMTASAAAKKILIIEDDALLSRMYQAIFKPDKYEAIFSPDGQDGLAKARSHMPAVILLDIMLPKLNGMQVLEKLKADPETMHIPVVVLTNLSGERDAQQALVLGAVRYIIKSEHKPDDLERIISQIVFS